VRNRHFTYLAIFGLFSSNCAELTPCSKQVSPKGAIISLACVTVVPFLIYKSYFVLCKPANNRRKIQDISLLEASKKEDEAIPMKEGRKWLLAAEKEGRDIVDQLLSMHQFPQALSYLIAEYAIPELSCFLPMESHLNGLRFVKRSGRFCDRLTHFDKSIQNNGCFTSLCVRTVEYASAWPGPSARALVDKEPLKKEFLSRYGSVAEVVCGEFLKDTMSIGISCRTLAELCTLLSHRGTLVPVDSQEYNRGIELSMYAVAPHVRLSAIADCLEYARSVAVCSQRDEHRKNAMARALCRLCEFQELYQKTCPEDSSVSALTTALRSVTPGFTSIYFSEGR
jgi:hypothetical protein